MTTRLSKQQLLDGLKNAGVNIPVNASSAHLRELYEVAVNSNAFKDGEEASADLDEVTAATAATAVLSLENPAANIKAAIQPSEATGATPKILAKSNADVRSEVDAKLNYDVKSDAAMKTDATAARSLFNASDVTAFGQNAGNEPTDLDYQLQILRKRHELLKLQHAIAALECGESSQPELPQIATPFATSSRLTFRDIEHAIVKFDGENQAYIVSDFLRNFDCVMDMGAAEELFKYTSLCNSLTGTAKLLLNKTDVMSYAQLKAALIKEFGRAINRG